MYICIGIYLLFMQCFLDFYCDIYLSLCLLFVHIWLAFPIPHYTHSLKQCCIDAYIYLVCEHVTFILYFIVIGYNTIFSPFNWQKFKDSVCFKSANE